MHQDGKLYLRAAIEKCVAVIEKHDLLSDDGNGFPRADSSVDGWPQEVELADAILADLNHVAFFADK